VASPSEYKAPFKDGTYQKQSNVAVYVVIQLQRVKVATVVKIRHRASADVQ
jgi:hypothetical protein